jgi:hypothetical protein
MRFYTGNMFPSEYRNAILVARHGSWNRSKKFGGDIAVVSLNENGTVKSVDPNPCARDVALDPGRTTMPRIAALLMLRSTMKTVSAPASRSFRGSLPHARMMSGASAVNSAAFARVVGIARGPADVDVQVATFDPAQLLHALQSTAPTEASGP